MSTCTTLSRELTEPLAGTAPTARSWLLVEQAGPWGARALTESHFDPELGRELQRRVAGTGVEIALIRRPGRHADRPPAGRREVYLAHTAPGGSWVRQATLDPVDLLDLDFAALGAGTHDSAGTAYDGDPLALVCTNGRRDRCCALLGRPLAAELAAAGHAQVREVTHLGGHRFSPTMLVLPYGYAYGRLSAHTAKDVLEATHHGRMVPEWCRGRSYWPRPLQAAELAVRQEYGLDAAEALVVEAVDPAQEGKDLTEVTIRHLDGRRWQASVRRTLLQPARPESCLKAAGNPTAYQVVTLAADAAQAAR